MDLSYIYPSYKRPEIAMLMLYNIVNQSFNKNHKCEVILSVDSTDPLIKQYESLCEQYALIFEDRVDFKILLLVNDTDGLLDAKNNAVKESNSEYIMMLDDDLLMEEDYTESLYKDLKLNGDVVAVSGYIVSSKPAISHTQPSDKITEIPNETKLQTLSINSKDGEWRSVFGQKEQVMDWSDLSLKMKKDQRYEMDYFVNSYMFRKSAYEKIGGYNSKLNSKTSAHEEVDFTYRLGKKGKLLFNPFTRMWHITIGKGGIYKGKGWDESKDILEEEYKQALPYFIESINRH